MPAPFSPRYERSESRPVDIDGEAVLTARTGYTGEDGYEIMPSSDTVVSVWNSLVDAGAAPCGLASRDLLRLEAGFLLHGNDMDTSINPYEAGLDRFVDPDRDDYIPGEALRRIRDAGTSRKLVGFEMVGRGIARHGYDITDGEKKIGEVSSGSVSFTLDKNIGLGYVPTDFSALGTPLWIHVRRRSIEAVVRPLPLLFAECIMNYPDDLKYTKEHEWLRIESENDRRGGHHRVCRR